MDNHAPAPPPVSVSPAPAPLGDGIYSSSVIPTPAAPMSSRVKKLLLIILIVVAVFIAGGLITLSVISTVNRINYTNAMELARSLHLEVDALHLEKGCGEALGSVNVATVNAKTYDGYIQSCRNMTSHIESLLTELESDSAIERDPTLKLRFESFRDLYRDLIPKSSELETKLKPYQTWHAFVLASVALSPSNPDTDFEKAASILKNSGNDIFSAYADGWLERIKAYNESYRTYAALKPGDSDGPALLEASEKIKSALQQWEAVNTPDLAQISGLRFGDLAALNNEFTLFYEATKSAYEANL